MKSRKLWSVLLAVSAVLIFYSSETQATSNNPVPTFAADGTAPLPPLPKPDLGYGPSTLVADGTAPLPPLPPPKGAQLA